MTIALKIHPEQIPAESAEKSTLSLAERKRAALRVGGIDAQVDENGKIDVRSFVLGSRKRWSRVIAKLAE